MQDPAAVPGCTRLVLSDESGLNGDRNRLRDKLRAKTEVELTRPAARQDLMRITQCA